MREVVQALNIIYTWILVKSPRIDMEQLLTYFLVLITCQIAADTGNFKDCKQRYLKFKNVLDCRKLGWTDYPKYPAKGSKLKGKIISHLFLNNNKIKRIDGKSHFPTYKGKHPLKLLDFSDNIIESVEDEDFEHTPSLQVLAMANNEITHLSRLCFQHLKKLRILILQQNRLKQFSPILQSKYLEILDLTWNDLKTIEPDILFNSTSLEVFMVTGNQIESIDGRLLRYTPKIKILKLSDNKLKNFSWDLILNQQISPNQLHISNNRLTTIPNLSDIQIKLAAHSNPFHCDCALDWLRQAVFTQILDKENVNRYICDSPPIAKGIHFLNVSTVCDVDECTSTDKMGKVLHSCHRNTTCVNTFGSYRCQCKAGFISSGRMCTDEDECAFGDTCDMENGFCTNTIGSYICQCNRGFTLEKDNKTCKDIDECSITKPCGEALCQNSPGSFECRCSKGFELSSTQGTYDCKDINECKASPCDKTQLCTNLMGTFSCTCPSGFAMDDSKCTDINECFENDQLCNINSTCRNVAGGYICVCNDGYHGNGTWCRREHTPWHQMLAYTPFKDVERPILGVILVLGAMMLSCVICYMLYTSSHKRLYHLIRPTDNNLVDEETNVDEYDDNDDDEIEINIKEE